MNAAAILDVGAAVEPLRWFEAATSAYLAGAAAASAEDLPQLHRTLLAHNGSMTERLERWAGGPITLQVLSSRVGDERYARWTLLLGPGGRCAALAGVCLSIGTFGAALRDAVLEGRQPLGRLLFQHGMAYESVPYAFFVLDPTVRLAALLQMNGRNRVSGRRTDLRIDGRTVGHIVEVLPCYEQQTSTGGPDTRSRP